MKINFGEQIKTLRKNKNISQDKLAEYLNVSFQAVSKWENGNTYPDISLLPDIARFFNITIDELLQVEIIDENKLFVEYYKKAEKLYKNKEFNEKLLNLWVEAYKKMPNNIQVKEMLFSAYFDIDMFKYQKEIIELGNDIYNSNCNTYYKGQAIHHLAILYSNLNNYEYAEKWIQKSFSLLHSKEILLTKISKGQEKIDNLSWGTYWFLDYMYWTTIQIVNDTSNNKDLRYKQKLLEKVIIFYETAIENNDMCYDFIEHLCDLLCLFIDIELETTNNIEIIKDNLLILVKYSIESTNIKNHMLNYPLLDGYYVYETSGNNKLIEFVYNYILTDKFQKYDCYEWYNEIKKQLNNMF